jgi:hypothetical protein
MSNRTLGIIAVIGAIIVAVLVIAALRLDSVGKPTVPAIQNQQ